MANLKKEISMSPSSFYSDSIDGMQTGFNKSSFQQINQLKTN